MRLLEPCVKSPGTRALLAGFLILGFGFCILLVSASSDGPQSPPTAGSTVQATGSTVIFVRHAEKDPSGDAKDPGLGQTGRKRAIALARLLAHAGVTSLYASEYHRAQETLAPLAEAKALKVEVVPAGDSGRLIAALSSLPAGSVSVVAGHSNTIPELIEKMGGHMSDLLSTPQGLQLRETEFDRLFVLTLGPPEKTGDHVSRAAISTLELRYGD